MADALIVEVRDARGRLLSRHPVTNPQIRVGRAFDNDVVVDDPHVDPHHAVLDVGEEGATVRVSDLGSVNGTRLGRRSAAAEGESWPLGQPIEVGRTTLTIFATDAPIAPALPLQSNLVRAVSASRLRAFALIAGTGLYFFVSLYLVDYDEEGWAYSIGGALVMVLLLVLWAGAWALGGKLASRPSAFTAHLGWVGAFTLLALPIDLAASYVTFLFPASSGLATATWIVAAWALVSALLFGHIELVSRRSRRFKLIASGGGVGVLFGLAILAANTGENHAAAVSGSLGALRRVPMALIPASSLEEVQASLEDMRRALDEDALEITFD